MKERIQKHIDGLFTDAPKTRKTMELKEELTQNTIEKYEDLISEGYREEDAFQNVIDTIGDVSELFEILEEKNLLSLSAEERKKKATLTAVSVGLYIFAAVVFFASHLLTPLFPLFAAEYYYLNFDMLGLVLTGLLCIPPSCMLIYAANMYPTFHKQKDNLVEKYKEGRYSANREKAIRTSASILIWTITLTVYFFISFATWEWMSTWIAFLIGGCVQAAVLLLFNLRRKD